MADCLLNSKSLGTGLASLSKASSLSSTPRENTVNWRGKLARPCPREGFQLQKPMASVNYPVGVSKFFFTVKGSCDFHHFIGVFVTILKKSKTHSLFKANSLSTLAKWLGEPWEGKALVGYRKVWKGFWKKRKRQRCGLVHFPPHLQTPQKYNYLTSVWTSLNVLRKAM